MPNLVAADGRVEKKGGTERQTDRQKETAALYSRLVFFIDSSN